MIQRIDKEIAVSRTKLLHAQQIVEGARLRCDDIPTQRRQISELENETLQKQLKEHIAQLDMKMQHAIQFTNRTKALSVYTKIIHQSLSRVRIILQESFPHMTPGQTRIETQDKLNLCLIEQEFSNVIKLKIYISFSVIKKIFKIYWNIIRVNWVYFHNNNINLFAMIRIRPDEISAIIRQQIEQYDKETRAWDVGTVFQVGDGITRIYGLEKVIAGELLEYEDGTMGIALNLETKNVGAVLLGEGRAIHEGSSVRATGKVAQVKVGTNFLGRIVNSLRLAIDGLGPITASETRLIEVPAPGIIERRSVYEPLLTGLVSVDAIIPVGRGQRELIVGDRQTGKTAVAIDSILNQKGKDVICVYVAIGQKASSIAQVVNILKERGGMAYTVIVAATADSP